MTRPLKVFLSHAHADAKAVRTLYDRLVADGVDAWLDKEKLIPGHDWDYIIRKAVYEADVVIVCLSKQFNQRGYRQKEVRIALNEAEMIPEDEIFIIPARLDNCQVPRSLQKWQWVDVFEEGGYEKLFSSLTLQSEKIAPEVRVFDDALYRKRFNRPRRLILGVLFLAILAIGGLTSGLSQLPLFQASTTPFIEQTFTASITLTAEPSYTPTAPLTPTIIPSPTPEYFDPEMIYIPAGEFDMGDNRDTTQYKKHKVYLSAFYIDAYEVTNTEYAECVVTNGCVRPVETFSPTRTEYYDNSEYAQYPVINVTWEMAKFFCESRGAHLPTEAQWEKAAQGDFYSPYPWDGNFNCKYAHLGGKRTVCNNTDTVEVGSYTLGRTLNGIYDLSGNVAEWINDDYADDYYDRIPDGAVDPKGPSGMPFKVVRGGSWYSWDLDFGTVYFRGYFDPEEYKDYIGFRCAKDAP